MRRSRRWLGVEPADVARDRSRGRSAAITTAASRSTTSPIPRKPKEIAHQKTGGIGVHRFDMDERYAYISTEMDGYIGNILVIYDIAIRRSRRKSRAGGCRDSTSPAARRRPGRGGSTGCIMRCASATRCGRAAGTAASASSTVSDIAKPKTIGGYNYHPLFPEPTHTVMPVPAAIDGRRIALAIDEEDQAQSANEEAARRGRAHACMLTFDVSDPAAIKPLGQFQVSELEFAVQPRTPGARFGAHQFCERMTGTSFMRSGSAAACASSTWAIRCAARSRLFHPRAGGAAARRRKPTTWRWMSPGWSTSSTAMSASTCWNSAGSR